MQSEPSASQGKPDTSPDNDSGEKLQSGLTVGEMKRSGAVQAGKAMTVCGALFGAAAAVPT